MLTTLLALTLSATPLPPAFGFAAVQCVPVREVVCVIDVDYTTAACLADVPAAVDTINRAVGHEVMHFAGLISPAGIPHAFETGVLMVAGWASDPAPHALALTGYHVAETGWPCVERPTIVLSPRVARKTDPGPFNPTWVIAHELVHALGGGHADAESRFVSRMAPAYDQTMKVPLAPVDVAALRAAYPTR